MEADKERDNEHVTAHLAMKTPSVVPQQEMKRPGSICSSASHYRSVYEAVDRIRELIDTGKLTIPVLSISGEASFGEAQKPFVEAFAGNIIKHVVVPNSGHFVAEEQPEALAVEFRTFFGD